MSSTSPLTGVELNLSTQANNSSHSLGLEDQTQITGSSDFIPGQLVGGSGQLPFDMGEQGGGNGGVVKGSEGGKSSILNSLPMHKIVIIVFVFLAALAGLDIFVGGEDSFLLSLVQSEEEAADEEGLEFVDSSTNSPVASTASESKNVASNSAEASLSPNIETAKPANVKEAQPPSTNIDESIEGLTDPLLSEAGLAEVTTKQPNPYWALPNEVGEKPALDRLWSAKEEEAWRAAISHRFTWQRYKAILEVQKLRLTGSEVILWDALQDAKFWVRFRALMALADFGIILTTRMVQDAIGKVRPSVVSNYFKRFMNKPTVGELYTLRQAIRVVDDWRARLNILHILDKHDLPGNELYFVAASHDSSPAIRKFSQYALRRYTTASIIEARKKVETIMSQPVISLEEQKGLKDLAPHQNEGKQKAVEVDPFQISEVEMYHVDWQETKKNQANSNSGEEMNPEAIEDSEDESSEEQSDDEGLIMDNF